MAKNRKKGIAPDTKTHPWRLCPIGKHWVSTHPLKIPPSKSKPEGSTTTRRGHCAQNPTHRDQLYPDEITEIAAQHFSGLKNKPCSLPLKFKNGNAFDELIAGWVQYWNDIFQPTDPLDPNLVKALIATESSFKPEILANKRNSNSARGLTQITNKTRKILADEQGELRDHFLTVTKIELNNPNINICAGVRWLFQKRVLASSHLKRQATWIEAVYEYKGASTAPKKRAQEIMDEVQKMYEVYKKCGKS